MKFDKNKLDTNPLNTPSSSESLLSILDDKNKKIETLKKQIQNQKLQLMYYLNKNFDHKKIMQLSKSCLPDAQESSITVNLACTKFFNTHGIRSKIICLYDRLRTIDGQLSTTVQLQEFILRKIIFSIRDFVQRQNLLKRYDMELYSFLRNTHQLDILSRLLENTATLSMKLNTLRICCKQLIIVEDERNAIVEQVYALPVEERLSSNYLAELQMEKMEMERKIQQIEDNMKPQQKFLQHDWKEECDIKAFEIEPLEKDEDMKINEILEKVNNEALMVLEKTIEHKNRREVIEFSFENAINVEKVLKYIRAIFKQSNSDSISSLDKNRIFAAIKSEIRTQIDALNKLHKTEMMTKLKDIEMLQQRLWELSMEKDELKDYLKRMEKDLNEIRTDLRNEITKLAGERDLYKTQVDDLQAIRSAYAQLVERQPHIAAIERKYKKQIVERDQIIKELQKEKERATAEQIYQNNIIETQSNEIKCLIKVVEKFKLMVTDNSNNYLNSASMSCDEEEDNLVNEPEADENNEYQIIHDNNSNDLNSHYVFEKMKIDETFGRKKSIHDLDIKSMDEGRNKNMNGDDVEIQKSTFNQDNRDSKLVETIFKPIGDFHISNDELLDLKTFPAISSTDLNHHKETPEADSCISTLELHSLTNDPKLCMLKTLIDTDSIMHGCLNISSNKISIEFNYNPMMLMQNNVKLLDCHHQKEVQNDDGKRQNDLQDSHDVDQLANEKLQDEMKK